MDLAGAGEQKVKEAALSSGGVTMDLAGAGEQKVNEAALSGEGVTMAMREDDFLFF